MGAPGGCCERTFTVNGGPGPSIFHRFMQKMSPPKASSMMAAVRPPCTIVGWPQQSDPMRTTLWNCCCSGSKKLPWDTCATEPASPGQRRKCSTMEPAKLAAVHGAGRASGRLTSGYPSPARCATGW